VPDPSKQSDEKRKMLEDRLSRLEALVRLSSLFSNDLKHQLQVLSGRLENDAKPLLRKANNHPKADGTRIKKKRSGRANRVTKKARKKR
jgi:hypothetical protein